MKLPIFMACAASAALSEPNPFRSPYLAEMVAVPPGSFRMGSENGNRDERPVRTVAVPGFLMGRTEVTLGWYLRCMADGVCEAPSWWSIGYFEEVPPGLPPAAARDLPITGVSWRQARLF